MPIEGWYKFQDSGPSAPYMRAQVVIPRLKLQGGVDFLVDTGASYTCLNPHDVTKLKINHADLHPAEARVSGVGGHLQYHEEEVFLVFGGLAGRSIWPCSNLLIAAKINDPALAERMEMLPSLLGRDFLNLCSITSDPHNNQFSVLPHRIENHIGNRLILPP